MAEGHRKVEGVLLGAPDGLRLVSLATGESWHAVAAVGQAVEALVSAPPGDARHDPAHEERGYSGRRQGASRCDGPREANELSV